MKLSTLVVFTIGLILVSCKNSLQKTEKNTTISGKLYSKGSNKIYLKKVDNFNYLNDDFIIDSTTISTDGEFEFELSELPTNLISLSTKKYLPASYIILRRFPHNYFFSSCSNFFASEPSFYLNSNDSINIEWHDNRIVDSIVHKNQSNNNQTTFREYYLNASKNVAGHLDRENTLDYLKAWSMVQDYQKKEFKLINLTKIYVENSFDNYMYSEIVLNNLNGYLNWFEDFYPDKVHSAIIEQKESDLYNQIFLKYLGHSWNPNSFEYYKFTERFVNYQMNIHNKSFKTYYVPSPEKMRIAEKVLKGKNKERYLRILDSQIKNVL